MRKTWTILCAAAVLAFSLAGCAGNKTQGNLNDLTTRPSADPSLAPSVQPDDIHGTEDTGDLAGADGMVDGDKPGQADNSPLERAGDAIRDTVDDVGNGARNAVDDAGDGVRGALDDLGDAARNVGRDAKEMIESR